MTLLSDIVSYESIGRLVIAFVGFVISVIILYLFLKYWGITIVDSIILLYRSTTNLFIEQAKFYDFKDNADLIKFKKNKWYNENMDSFFISQNQFFFKIPDKETQTFLGFSEKDIKTIDPNYFTNSLIIPISSVKKSNIHIFRNPKEVEYYIEVGMTLILIDNLYTFYFIRNINENFKTNYFRLIESNEKKLYPISKKKHTPIIDIHNCTFSITTLNEAFTQSRQTWLKQKFKENSVHVIGKIKQGIDELLLLKDHRDLLIRQIESLKTQCIITKNIGFDILSKNSGGEVSNEFIYNTTNSITIYEKNISQIIEGINKNINNVSIENVYRSQLNSDLEALREIKIDSKSHIFKLFTNYLDSLSIILEFDLESIVNNLNPHNLLFIGKPYIGKSHGLAHYCSNRLENTEPSIIIQALSSPSNNWGIIVQSQIELLNSLSEIELLSFLSDWCHKIDLNRKIYIQDTEMIDLQTQLLICIDGLDESKNKLEWIDRINNLKSYVNKFQNIKFVFTARPSFKKNTFLEDLDSLKIIYLPEKSDAPFDVLKSALFKEYDITIENSNWIDYYINNSLSLTLFCEQNMGETISVENGIELSFTGLVEKKIKALEEEIVLKLENKIKLEDGIVKTFLLTIKEGFLKNESITHNRIHEIISNHENTKYIITTEIVNQLLELLCSNETLIKITSVGMTNLPVEYSIIERSILEYLIAKDVFDNINPNEFPPILHELSGALEMIAIMLFVEKDVFIGESDIWVGELDDETLTNLKNLVLTKVNSNNIKQKDIDFVKSQILN